MPQNIELIREHLKRGTYVRELDGRWHLYHSTSTSWNHPVEGLRRWRELRAKNMSFDNSIFAWRKVEDQQERNALREYLCSELLPGEYVEVEDAGL